MDEILLRPSPAPLHLNRSITRPRSRKAAPTTQASTFAANRARGRIALSVEHRAGRTRRAKVYEDGSLRVRFPNGGELEAVIVNTAGGIAGGDRFALDVTVGDNAQLTVTTAAAEKVYRSLGADAEVDVKLSVGRDGVLRWLPQETIVFNAVALRRTIDVEFAEGAAIVLAEAVVFGRAAMGEVMEQGRFIDRWRVHRNGRLIFADTVVLDGAISAMLAEPAVASGAGAVASLFVAPATDATAAAVRARSNIFAGEVAISAWNGFALARLCAGDGDALRRDIKTVLAALGGAPLPRLWLN